MNFYGKISLRYVRFLEKKTHSVFGWLFYFLLYALSVLYGIIVGARNRLYDTRILKTVPCCRPVISIGNISWAGSGKTTLAAHMARKLGETLQVAVLRRGYGTDEGMLLAEKGVKVYSSANRLSLSCQLRDSFDLFVLDDGFQYRKLYRDVNILLMAAREFTLSRALIPASVFREPLNALGRADILVINRAGAAIDCGTIARQLNCRFPKLSIYCASYRFTGFTDTHQGHLDLMQLANARVAAFSATGYPDGFFQMLTRAGVTLRATYIYPDHYQLTEADVAALEKKLVDAGVEYLCITHKDKFHFPNTPEGVRRVVAHIAIDIENEELFFNEVKRRLTIAG
ncbi:MAG: tetraacyldisaccharide 4'-kinase [Candidatus Omnitrophota bacterium]